MSYSRFLVLYMVGSEGAGTQRTVAERLGVSDPSVSRMVRVLADGGWLRAVSDPAGGNRNQLRLTAAGEQLVQRWGVALEERMAALVDAAGVPYGAYQAHTQRLVAALDAPAIGSPQAQPARTSSISRPHP
jgi:DNA-binding transcriptional LysR family regulator